MAGSWVGLGLQVNPDGKSDTWAIKMRIDANGSARIDYPSLQCGGTLIPVRTLADGAEYRERLTYGADKCVDGGTVGVHLRAGKLMWYWTGERTNFSEAAASAVLRRASSAD